MKQVNYMVKYDLFDSEVKDFLLDGWELVSTNTFYTSNSTQYHFVKTGIKMELTKFQLNEIRGKLFEQQDKPCKEGEPTFHEALGFECGMIFMSNILGLDWREISKR